MKLGVIGAAGVRTPLLLHGLAEAAEGLAIEEIALFDPEQERLALMTRVARAIAERGGMQARLVATDHAEAAMEGARYVITAIRAGDIAARIQDERIALAHGLVGQETVGAGGCVSALRNLQPMLNYGRMLLQRAPHSTLINFTNPVGIISQALLAEGVRIIGVCDTPLEAFEQVARALGRDPLSLKFDYLGLNHLGWITAIREAGPNGRDLLPELLASARLPDCYRHAMFPPEFLRDLGLLPTEYLYFYYFPDLARQNTKLGRRSRGEDIELLNRDLFRRIALSPDHELIAIYEQYLRNRNAGYMSLETSAGREQDEDRPLYSRYSGYERIATLLLTALSSPDYNTLPLTIRNGSVTERAILDLESDDAIEINCQVGNGQILPWHPGRLPAQVKDLLLQVKEYERLVCKAAITHKRDLALRALAVNPLVGASVADVVLRAYETAFGGEALGLTPSHSLSS